MVRRARASRIALLALGLGMGLGGVALGPAHAQPLSGTGMSGSGTIVGTRAPLSSRLGLNVGRNLVYSPDAEERLRAVDRLASLGTPEAIEALLEAMESGSPLARDPLARLAVVRALAPHAGRSDVRTFLVREMMDAGARRDVTSGLAGLVRDTAALVLARRGDADAIQALATAAVLRGPAGEAARAAMIAVPPRGLDPILFEETEEEPEPADDEAGDRDKKPAPKKDAKDTERAKPVKETDKKPKFKKTPRVLSGAVITFLGDLGDLRAIPALREELDRADRPTRAAAALALAKLGDASVAKVVRGWVDENDARFALAATEVLIVLGDAGAVEALKKVLEKEPVRSQAVKLAYELASPEVVEPLAKLLPDLDGTDQLRALMALGRAGAADKIVPHLGDAKLGPAATSALAMCSGEQASAAIEKGLGDSAKRRAFARVAVMRAIVLRERVSGLDDVLVALSASSDASDVEVGALGRVALGDASVEKILAEAKDDKPQLALARVSGAARGALSRKAHGGLEALAKELADVDAQAPTQRQIAAGIALLSTDASDKVSFLTLLQMAEGGGPLAPLAARALPRRADETMKKRLLALLGGTDPTVRVGIALGLADSPHKAAVSWLAHAYVREEDVQVRRALIASLTRRSESQRTSVLELARDLDPDAEVRSLAAAGLSGRGVPDAVLRGGVNGDLVAFFSVAGADGSAAARSMRLVLPSGVALPLVTAADGALLMPGVPYGRASLELGTIASAAAPPATTADDAK